MKRKNFNNQSGISLIEVLIALSLFLIIALGIYFTYANILEIINKTRDRTLARSLLDREIENIRGLEYEDVGIYGGYPAGVIPASQDLIYEGKVFTIDTFVRNIDDTFDGVTGGVPNDTAPADYRLVELQITCEDCLNFYQMDMTTWVAPENLETVSDNGSLFVHVFDADGEPVLGADVTVVNTDLVPNITIIDASDINGDLKLIDIPPSVISYEISVSKNGYSSAQTYTPGEPFNPNPVQPHATVATQTVTEISLAIDELSSIDFLAQDYFCSGIDSAEFYQEGEHLIGSGPDVPRYSANFTTDSNGEILIEDLPWDVYTFSNQTANYDFAGSSIINPMEVEAGVDYEVFANLMGTNGNSLLIKAVNSADGMAINNPSSVSLSTSGFSESRQTGEWFISQTDWSGNQYSSQDGSIETDIPPGELSIRPAGMSYPTSTNSFLISNTYDLGTPFTEVSRMSWTSSEPPGAGPNSVKFQVASNNDLGPWTYIGPDGTVNTFFTTSGSSLGAFHDGNRYLRYKVYLNTINQNYTPYLYDVRIDFSSDCISKSQVFWNNLGTGDYDITVTNSGYDTATSSITVGSGYQEITVELNAI